MSRTPPVPETRPAPGGQTMGEGQSRRCKWDILPAAEKERAYSRVHTRDGIWLINLHQQVLKPTGIQNLGSRRDFHQMQYTLFSSTYGKWLPIFCFDTFECGNLPLCKISPFIWGQAQVSSQHNSLKITSPICMLPLEISGREAS